MSFELKEVREWADGTVVHPKYEVFDQRGDTDFTITDSTSWSLTDSDGDVVANATCTVNNSDSDLAGNTIKTVKAAVDLTETWAVAGHYVLVFLVLMTSGETEKLSVPIRIKDVP